MARAFFVIILLLHALIHIMGFVKAFKLADIQQLTLPISKTAGMLWLLSALLFIITIVLLIIKNDMWWMVAIPAVVLSQLLIFQVWQDAKYGTIINIITAVAIIIGYGVWNFNIKAKQQLQGILPTQSFPLEIITQAHLDPLPPVVQRWLKRAQVIGKERINTVHLHQKGKMRTTPNGAWMPVQAEQYFTTNPPAFVWTADVKMFALFHLAGIDVYHNGKGSMLIQALSLLPVVDAKGAETDQGTLLRYLGEICWFPTAALNDYITWEAIDSTSAKATMTYGGASASGTFYYNIDGDMIGFEADRYYGRKAGATLERWHIENTAYGERAGIRIPVASEVTWKLKEGDFTWFKLMITDIEYNNIPARAK
ncbi:MAG: DUF6544 family protein [Saprospiraceae bacterium]